MDHTVASFEAKACKVLRNPYFDLGPHQQRERMAVAHHIVQAILQDPEVSFRRNATGVISLVGGNMDNTREVMAAAAGVNGCVAPCSRNATIHVTYIAVA